MKAPFLIGAALGALISTPLLAQDTAATQTPQAMDTESDAGTIIVTARRRAESLQDTPVAISAFDAQVLEDRQINQTSDLETITPNLQFKTAGQLSGNSAATVVFIRGIGQLDPTAAVDPGVGIYLDEVYVGRAVGGAIDFGDIAGVEVLRGPQGTLFGRNTIGGAILVRTKQPELGRFGADVRLRLGSDSLMEGFAALNIPLGDTLAARVSGGFRKRDGYVIREYDGIDLGNDDSATLNGALYWEASPDIKVNIRGDYTKRDENGAPFVFAGVNRNAPVAAIASVAAGCPGATIPFAPLTPGDPRFGAPNVPQINDARCANNFQDKGPFVNGGTAPVLSTSEVWGVSGTVTANVTSNVLLKSISAYRSTQSRGVRDADNTPLLLITTDVGSQSDQYSQELQLQYESPVLNGIIGGYYFNEKTNERATVPLAFPPSPPVIGSLLAGGPGSRDLQVSDLETDSIAVFGELSVKPIQNLEISGGLRYTRDKKKYHGIVFNLFPATLPDPDPLPTLAIPQGGPLFIYPGPYSQSFSALTGSASVRYSWTRNVSTYISYSRSFKSGGFNTRYNAAPPGNVPTPFDEEKVDSYEIGAKFDFGDFRFNAAAFQADYSNIQLIFRQGVVPLLFNGGKARIRGLEGELSYHPRAYGLRIDIAASTLNDEILSITPVPGATATVQPGDDLPFTPSFQGNFGIGYEIPLNDDVTLTPRFDGNYSASLKFITGSVPEIEQDGYFVGNASVTLANKATGWKLTGGVQNLFDELYLVQGNASLGTLGYAEKIYARPRSWYVQASISF
ncbi:iron complex outermembrane receptor protein [Sphingobium sp. B2D3A]|uniref:TonB-dependent receptor n=1 Tax=Sphingobium TaxID=165695 RepID=UPI0015EB51EA|nr:MULTISPECIES: TonB-dependent receptor [Sphingobium]MCW2338445.1 iron complex outermembrane receptor protein [Sphingobium sp. B2D3A]MCW2361443.1 iron complex outermembrane receptor protein [Sphingobium sp. B10D3B]MCW2384903.1 iron complex outermembrane receptor protein [Sphingobium sp. B2D3D]MCW2387694.1 iron complex outermembrane receptor protein [Sphingobium sp. B11D3B]MCW2401878.1 iron complex outermembrane receptor protein [Sphingobium sp. B10D7B]